MARQKTYAIDTIYSPDDGGWYCDVFDETTGGQVFQTDVFRERSDAENAGRLWDEWGTQTNH